jgi:microsomal dipeptidase-like Zn-dependent dipeptidase
MTALMSMFVHGRPAEATSLRRTVEARAAAFHDLVRRSEAKGHPLLPILELDDLRRLVAERRAGRPVIGVLLGLEGAHPIEDGASISAEVDWLHGLGYRLVGLVHRFDNAFAGSSEGVAASGLHPRGLALAQELQRRRMVVDVAHLSSPAIQALGAARLELPVIYSHGGLAAPCRGEEACDADRNLTPADAAAIVRTGGVIGVGYWREAVGRRGIGSIVSAMEAIRDALYAEGIEQPLNHLAIGSDFDGFVRTAVDAAGHPLILGAVEASLGAGTAQRIGWLNACRALARALGAQPADIDFCREIQ